MPSPLGQLVSPQYATEVGVRVEMRCSLAGGEASNARRLYTLVKQKQPSCYWPKSTVSEDTGSPLQTGSARSRVHSVAGVDNMICPYQILGNVCLMSYG